MIKLSKANTQNTTFCMKLYGNAYAIYKIGTVIDVKAAKLN